MSLDQVDGGACNGEDLHYVQTGGSDYYEGFGCSSIDALVLWKCMVLIFLTRHN